MAKEKESSVLRILYLYDAVIAMTDISIELYCKLF